MTATQRPSRSSASSRQSQPTPTTNVAADDNNTSNSAAVTNTNTTSNSKPTLQEQLDKAEAAVRKTRDATAQLHYWWRQHLFRLSCMVFVLCFYQARKPSEACIRNIKSINNNSEIVTFVSGWEAARFMANDSVVEIMGLILVAALTLFLSDPLQRPNLTFADRHYMVATALIPLQITSYFQNEKKIGCIQPLMERYGDLILSAISSTSSTTTSDADSDQNLPDPFGEDRSFPISLVFHTIVTLCCWFMNYQMQRRNEAIKQVMHMKKILENAERQATTTKTSTTAAAASSISGGGSTNNKQKSKK
ncbi:hypothetical protein MHU86_22379 [Fragilaria crotonensis]|nr:hypothetical protein MHU86_22379 [Fragilaria crotonensis]